MKVIIGADHAGFKYKEEIKKHLSKFDVVDVGTDSEETCDYPKFSADVAERVSSGEGVGIIVCGSGVGVSIVANKFKGVRAAVCYDEHSAEVSRLHNNANVLCLGERTTPIEVVLKMVDIFLSTDFSEEERHARRVDEISEIERNNFK